jgi:hypothetical protein
VYTEYLGCYNSRDRETVEDVDERLPRLDVTSSFTLVVKAVDCDICAVENGDTKVGRPTDLA